LQLGLLRRRRAIAADDATVCVTDDQSLARLRAVLPFQPTGAQERAIAEIRDDLKQPHPMQRLLHGDVGSGKTLVAYAACELVMASGHQAAVMAPTEILAEQHYKTLRVWAQASGRKLALLTATTPKTARKTTVAQLQAGRFADVLRIAEATGSAARSRVDPGDAERWVPGHGGGDARADCRGGSSSNTWRWWSSMSSTALAWVSERPCVAKGGSRTSWS
jgi:hypothetical protein